MASTAPADDHVPESQPNPENEKAFLGVDNGTDKRNEAVTPASDIHATYFDAPTTQDPEVQTPATPYAYEEMGLSDAKLKRYIRWLRFLLRLLIFLLAAFDTITMSYMLAVYYTTVNDVTYVPTPTEVLHRGPWHSDTVLWPTYVLFVSSAITLLCSTIILLAYLKSIKAANKADEIAGTIGYAVLVSHVVVWIATAVAYRLGKTKADTWGWSCSVDARIIQAEFVGVVDFKTLCEIQSSSWGASLAQAVVVALTLVVYWFSYSRLQQSRIMSFEHPDMHTHQRASWFERFVNPPTQHEEGSWRKSAGFNFRRRIKESDSDESGDNVEKSKV